MTSAFANDYWHVVTKDSDWADHPLLKKPKVQLSLEGEQRSAVEGTESDHD